MLNPRMFFWIECKAIDVSFLRYKVFRTTQTSLTIKVVHLSISIRIVCTSTQHWLQILFSNMKWPWTLHWFSIKHRICSRRTFVCFYKYVAFYEHIAIALKNPWTFALHVKRTPSRFCCAIENVATMPTYICE